jgi:signal transduction histidine kinase
MSLAPRLLAVLLLPIAICLVVFGLNTVRLRQQLMSEEAAREVRDHGTALQVTLDALLRDHRPVDLSTLVEDLSRPDRVLGVLVFDREGTLIDASHSVAGYSDQLRSLASRVVEHDHPVEMFVELSGHRAYAYGFAAGGRERDPSLHLAAIILRDVGYIDANVAAFQRETMTVCGIALAAIALGTWLAMRLMVAQPLAGLARGVEQVTLGELDVVIPIARDDEIGRVAKAFNVMTQSLKNAREELSSKQEANIALERRLQHAQRLALIGQLTATFAHQIGSPLNVILGRARYALKLGGQGDRDRRHFEEIVTGAESISRVIERFLSQARRVRRPVQPVDIGQLVRQAASFLEAECERNGIRPSLHVEPATIVEGRCEELEQVVLNLCLNAINAQPEGGTLLLTVRRAGENGLRRVELDVTDAGPGVPPLLRDKIFEPFFTTKGQGQGTGLGLAICEEIIRRHGGAIRVADAPGGGAAFHVSLPDYAERRNAIS